MTDAGACQTGWSGWRPAERGRPGLCTAGKTALAWAGGARRQDQPQKAEKGRTSAQCEAWPMRRRAERTGWPIGLAAVALARRLAQILGGDGAGQRATSRRFAEARV